MSTTLVTIAQDIQLPAHLRTPEAVARIAAENAAAAGGIKTSGFPRISLKANKFHESDGGELKTYMSPPAQPGQPALPLQCLEAVIVGANPGLSRVFYKGEWVEGTAESPDCSSTDGVVPDSHIVNKQNPNCASCPQAAWGSKISKLSGKDVQACASHKQLAILPAADLNYKALGLAITPGSLGNWGKYVQALSGRGFPLTKLVTNVTFDATANGVLNFTFQRFLSEAECAQVDRRAQGDDVKAIVAPMRSVVTPQLPPPVQQPQLPPPMNTQPQAPIQTQSPATTGVQFPPESATFGAGAPGAVPFVAPILTATLAPQQPAAPAAEPPKRKRRTRAEMDAEKAAALGVTQSVAASGQTLPGAVEGAITPPPAPAADPRLSHLPPAVLAAIQLVGVDTPAGQAMLAAFPVPAVQPAGAGFGGLVPATPVQAPTQPQPTTQGFGATQPAPVQTQPTPQQMASGADLVTKLRARMAAMAKPA